MLTFGASNGGTKKSFHRQILSISANISENFDTIGKLIYLLNNLMLTLTSLKKYVLAP